MKETKTIMDIIKETNLSAELEKSGGELRMRCPSPTHTDTEASCYINPDKDVFCCFGCGKAGGPVHFYAMVHAVSMAEAAQEVGFSSWVAANIIASLNLDRRPQTGLPWILKHTLRNIREHKDADLVCVQLAKKDCRAKHLLEVLG